MGVCLYEFMCGDLPIGADEEDPFNVYNLLINQKTISYPGYFHDK